MALFYILLEIAKCFFSECGGSQRQYLNWESRLTKMIDDEQCTIHDWIENLSIGRINILLIVARAKKSCVEISIDNRPTLKAIACHVRITAHACKAWIYHEIDISKAAVRPWVKYSLQPYPRLWGNKWLSVSVFIKYWTHNALSILKQFHPFCA